jgi:hypothetical protein
VSIIDDPREQERHDLYVSGVEAFPDIPALASRWQRRWAYRRICLKAFADAEGSLGAAWTFTRASSVISQNARDDEGNAYLRLGEAYERLRRDGGARAAYERG